MTSLPTISVPSFELILPSSGKKVKYRPFLMKEYKTLLLLKESTDEDVLRIIEELVDVCTYEKLKISDMPSIDVEYLFLNIRAKSVGETVDLYVTCDDCEHNIEYSMDITQLKLPEKNPDHQNKIMISPSVGIELRLPKFLDTMMVMIDTNSSDADKILNRENRILDLAINSIKSVFTTDGTYVEITDENRNELEEYFNLMTLEKYEEVKKFFDTMPTLKHDIHLICDKCGKENHSVLKGLINFFV